MAREGSPWSSCGGRSVFLHQPRRTGSHFLSHKRPRSPAPPITRKFSTSPQRRRLGGSTTLAPLSLQTSREERAHQHRQHPALGQGSFMFPLKGITLHLEKTASPIPTLLSRSSPSHEPSTNLFPSFCLSLLQESNFLCTLRARHLCEMPRNKLWAHPAPLRGPGELRTGQEDAGHPPLLLPQPIPSPRQNSVPNLTKSLKGKPLLNRLQSNYYALFLPLTGWSRFPS